MADRCCIPAAGGSSEPIATRITYRYIIDAFPRLGREPTLSEMERDLGLARDLIADALRALEAKGVLRVDPLTGRIMDAYPYSSVPTRHRVVFEDGTRLFCMCAVDCFYVPFLTGLDLTIQSRCFHCRAQIEIVVQGRRLSTAEPATTVIWSSEAAYDCPKTNFFCRQEHLLRWRNSAPSEPGHVRSLDSALEGGEQAAWRIEQSAGGLNEILWAPADDLVCYCREVPKATIMAAIARGAKTPQEIADETTACTGGWCQDTNPKGRCCCVELEALIEAHASRS